MGREYQGLYLILFETFYYLLNKLNLLKAIHIQAEFVPLRDPSLTEQYEYASEHDIKCLVVITDSDVSQKGSVKVGF